MSIKLKLVIIFLAITLIPALFGSIITFNNYKHSLEHSSISTIKIIADFTKDKITEYSSQHLENDIADMSHIYNIIQNMPELGDTGEVLIGKKSGNEIIFLNPLKYDAKAAFNRKVTIGSNTSRPIQEAAQGREGAGLSIDYRGEPVIAAWRYLPSLGWGIVVKIDRKEAFSDVEKLRRFIITVLAAILCLAILVALLVARSIASPLQKLAKGAEIIGSGNLDYRVGTNLRGEIGQLSRLFDKMTCNLKQASTLREVERQRLYSVLETLPVYVILLTPDYHVSFANKFFRDRFGEDHGKRCYEYLFNRNEPCDICETYKVLKTNKPLNWEWTGPDRRTYDIYDFPFIENDGSVHIMEMGIDITERKQAVEALKKVNETLEQRVAERTIQLRESAEDLIRAQAVANIGSWRLDVKNNTLSWSDQTYRIFGIPAATPLTYEIFLASVHEDDREYVNRSWQAAMRGERYDIEHRIRVGDSVKWVREQAQLEFDKDGVLSGGFGTVQDITGRKKIEDALKESEARVRLKLDSVLSPEGDIGSLELADVIDSRSLQLLMEDFYQLAKIPMAIIDLKGKALVGVGWQKICTKFHRVDPETCRYCVESDTKLTIGVKPGEFRLYKCKNNMWDVATPVIIGDKQLGNLFMGQFFFEDEKVDYELFRSQARRYGFDEKAYLAALDEVPRLSKETMKKGMEFLVKVSHIISNLSYSNIKLAKLFAERDALTISLKESEKRLRRTNENLEQFAYVASHDLQEPLRIMGNYSQLLEKRYKNKLDQDADVFIGYIVSSAKHMQKLITDLLTYSRIGKFDQDINKVDCNSILGKVMISLAPLIEDTKAIITHDHLPVSICNETTFVQLFQNLITNAIKFRREGEQPRIHIGAKMHNDEWLFSVRDNGIGIDDKYKDKIFMIFQRLHGRDKYPGTGIGLSICKKIVEGYGGRIWMESKVGEGSVFYFTIPVTMQKEAVR